MPNKSINFALDFPRFSGHASITPEEEQNEAGNDHGEDTLKRPVMVTYENSPDQEILRDDRESI